VNPSTDAMRVLLVTKGLDLGGVERMVVDLASGLSATGVDVEVAVVNSQRDRLAPVLEGADITLHRLDGTDRIGIGAGRRLTRLVTDSRFDIVHVHGPLPAVVARLATRGRRLVTTSHTPWGSLRLPTRIAWRATDGLDAATIAVSAAVATSLPPRARRRAVVIPHGIDTARIAATLQALTHVGTGTPVTPVTPVAPVIVVTVASHRDAKNYPNLLHGVRSAIDAGAPIRLVSIGDGPNLDAHVDLARTLGLGDVVTFRPSTVDVLTEMAGADLLVVASDYEGQPIVVAEALALGLPVVATAVGRVPEMVNTSVGRVVPPRDPAALGAALVELATNPGLRADMSAAARRQLQAWTLADVVAAHVALYADVIERSR
jgi:glycosyltransferase involved in cell wall biosynthesis